ncbi:FAD-binding oxidoreductase [Paracoccus sp. (in: a-proteobacteria)]|uniref:FAD-binding oxidoreductase n=1 Tax=Paracoccus sp. TaxID=267 RepID=UPI0026DF955B|nr:FAD-binding oxidoreductase [Paracoccus sp. (in: a-proteobacteria)]MDO5647915.1 FAD-binding oxidoreductase [Paracoccus sp. (in: a-proteobacteria)]
MLTPADQALAARLPAGVLRDVAPGYLDEPRGRFQGQAGLVAAPRDVQEAAAVIRACAEARVPVVPRGGGTGLVGGQVMPDGPAPLILSLERMAQIRAVYPDESVMITDAGVTLQSARDAAAGVGRQFPLSLASQGSAQIGGVLSTNAGGVNVLRYGNARALCLGIQAVMPNGDILNDLKRLRKDNTGYDLRDLLIGAEGTLGIITAASLVLAPIPAESGVAMLVVNSPGDALALLSLAQTRMAGCVTAFELIAGQGLRFLTEAFPDMRQPFDSAPEWAVLMQVDLPAGLPADAALEHLFIAASEAGLVTDGVIAQSGQQAADLWALREHIPLANRHIGAIASHDISLPLTEIARFIDDAGAMLGGQDVRINCFGHLGDGNLHYNLFPAPGRHRDDYDAIRRDLSRQIHELVVARGGSFSAEHGIGRLKVADLARWGDPVRLTTMRAIKAALDPAGIMNPGAVL